MCVQYVVKDVCDVIRIGVIQSEFSLNNLHVNFLCIFANFFYSYVSLHRIFLNIIFCFVLLMCMMQYLKKYSSMDYIKDSTHK